MNRAGPHLLPELCIIGSSFFILANSRNIPRNQQIDVRDPSSILTAVIMKYQSLVSLAMMASSALAGPIQKRQDYDADILQYALP